MKYQAAALALLLNTSAVLAGVQRRDGSDRRWGQCAGQNYNGPTDCPSGWTCQLQNPYYSQCLQGSGSGSTSGSGSASSGSSNSTGSTSTGSTGSTGSGTGTSGSGSKLGLGVSSPVPSTSGLASGVTSFGTVGSTGSDDGDDGDDDGEGTCDSEDEDEKTSSTGTTSAGKLAAGVVTNPSATASSGGSGTTSASGAGATGGSTKTDTTGSDTTGSDTTGSDTTGSNSTTSGSGNTQSGSGGSTGGGALATTTQYGPLQGSSPGACGCAGSWQNGDTTSGNDTMITTAAGGPSILDGYCGAGCGACYLLTSTGKPPCSDDACKVSASSAGQTLTVMVTNGCPTKGNEQWCSVPNKFGYEAHFDLAVQPPGWGNVVVSYEPTACPGSLTGNWAGCKCAGQSSPHEGTVPSGGKTSVS